MMAPAHISIAQVKAAVAAYFQIAEMELVSRRRSPGSAIPRQVAVYLAATLCRGSYAEIGAAFHRDHSTAIHAKKVIETRMLDDAELVLAVERIKAQILSRAFHPNDHEALASRLVIDTAAAFRTAGLALAATDPAAVLRLVAPVAAAFGIDLAEAVP